MADTGAIGGFLEIPDSVFQKAEKLDRIMINLQKTANQTATVVGRAFTDMADGAGLEALRKAIQGITGGFTSLKTAANGLNGKGGRNGLGNIGTQATVTTDSITRLTAAIDAFGERLTGKDSMIEKTVVRMAALRAQMDELTKKAAALQTQSGASAKTTKKDAQAQMDAQAEERRAAAMQKTAAETQKLMAEYTASAQKIRQLEAEYKKMEAAIKNYEAAVERIKKTGSGVVTGTEKAAYTDAKKNIQSVKEELEIERLIQQETAQKAVAIGNAVAQERKLTEEARAYDAELEKSREVMAAMRQYYTQMEKSSKTKVSYGDAMTSANSATTYNERTQAIKACQIALRSLSSSEQDADGKRRTLLSTIERLTEANKQWMTSDRQAADAAQKAAEKAEKAAEKEAQAAEKAAQAAAKQQAAQAREYNTSFEGGMRYAQGAKSVEEMRKAVQYLTAAKDKENVKTAEGRQRYQQLERQLVSTARQLNEVTKKTRELNSAHSGLLNISDQLARRLALLFSVSQITQYVKQAANVRAEFEMAQRSLQALLGNAAEANTIFNKTLNLALQSPFKVKQLVTFTRQLAAYRIENSKIYDTTKRLADVSAGLGVDMQRLILAYGQVKAAAFLKGTEVRQFTEAGVNVYKELQEYFKEERNEDYTTGQIVSMISAKKITFEDVERVFERMTDKGGMFYNMQLIQSETLKGKMMKFGDAVDIMLNDIGTSAEGLLKGAVDFATNLTRHWQALIPVIMAAVGAVGRMTISMASCSAVGRQISGTLATWRAGIAGATGAMGKFRAVFSGTVGSTLLVSGFTAALSVIIGLVASMVAKAKEFRKAVDEINQAFYKQQAAVRDLVRAYNELNRARNSGTERDREANLERRRELVKEIVEEMEKQGYKTDIDPLMIDEEGVQAQLNNVLKDYQQFLKDAYKAQYRAAVEMKQGMKGDVSDYDSTLFGFTATAEGDIDKAMHILGTNYNSLSEKSQKYYDTIKDGQKEEETQLDYLKRAINTLHQIRMEERGADWTQQGANRYVTNYIDELGNRLMGFGRQEKKVRDHLRDIFGDYFGKLVEGRTVVENGAITGLTEELTEGEKMEARLMIKTVMDKEGFGDAERDLAYWIANHEYHLDIAPDEESMSRTVNWVENYMNNFLEEREFKVRVKGEVIGTDPLSSFWEGAEKAVKSGEDAKKILGYLSRAEMKELTQEQFIEAYTKMFPDDENVAEDARKDWATIVRQMYADSSVINPDMVESLTTDMMEDFYTETAEASETMKKWFGIGDDKKRTTKTDNVWKERIALLEEMNKRYEKLRKTMEDDAAQQNVLNYYQASMEKAGMPEEIASAFVPTKEGLIRALKQLYPSVSDFKEQMDLKNKVAEMRVEINYENAEKELEKARQEVETAFSDMDLFQSLLDAGLSRFEIRQMFPRLSASDFSDVQSVIDRLFKGRTGLLWEDEYSKQQTDLTERRKKEETEAFRELTKAYGEQLSEQLQLDMWYNREKRKIESNGNLQGQESQFMRETLLGNLEREYREKSNENVWSAFKGSGFYTRVFDDVEEQSVRMLTAMQEALAKVKASMKDLTPAQMKTYMEAEEKITAALAAKNPFKTFISGIKDYNRLVRERKEMEEKYLSLMRQQQELERQISGEDGKSGEAERLQALKDALELKEREGSLTEEEKTEMEEMIEMQEQYLQLLRKGKKKVEEETQGTEENLRRNKNATDSTIAAMDTLLEQYQEAVELGKSLVGLFDELGGINADVWNDILEGMSSIGQAVASYKTGNYLSAASSLVSAVTSFVKAAGNESWIDEAMEELSDSISHLENVIGRLEDTMDSLWASSDIVSNYKEQMALYEEMVKDYNEQIALAYSRKDLDEGEITDLTDSLQDVYAEMEDLRDEYLEALGGIGEGNYADAAEEFAEAWMDAFNDVDDTLEALMETFDDYFNSLIIKKITSAATEKYLTPLFEMIDEMAEEQGGIEGLTDVQVSYLKELAEENLEAMDEYLSELMDLWGITPSGSSDSSLSALQQGIQTITEETGAALESLLNSMRFYLATQQADVAVIKSTLAGMASSSSSSASNPTLLELRSQTALLQSIDARLSGVIKAGHSQGGKGLKVFID